ncbi:MAG: hypothetical protein KDA52_19015 [Planctomycetaceae bacterium]|nr:hypothetical protein [Planctomycetaceae bacterium]
MVALLRGIALLIVLLPSVLLAEVPLELREWLGKQEWVRDTEGPILSLGNEGEFDETHMFAPAVANTEDGFQLWYCGSQGKVAERVFSMGLATSSDGRVFTKDTDNPVFNFGDGKHSVLTPTLLRNPDGTTLREEGQLRMWFSSTWFEGESGLHTLHETASVDGVNWSAPSEPQLENLYAPSVLKVGDDYRMWYTDVSAEPWKFRHASSHDGRHWKVTDEPVMIIDQAWEKSRLFYPTVLKVDDAYLMWYGSYWTGRENTTALGFAVSQDGLMWHKHPANPVLRPDPERPWESHYVTSQSVMRLDDGSFRMWYASRKQPPFVNKYFAINTAVWVPK